MLRLTLSGASLIAVTYGLARFGLGLFVPELERTLGLTSTEVGWVIGAAFAGFAAALLVAETLLERFGARAVAGAAGLCAILGTVGIAGATTATGAALAAASGGLSTGWATTALATAVQAQLIPRHQATSQTAINAGTSLGLILAAVGAMLAGQAWRQAWFAFAVVAMTATASAVASIDRRAGHADGPWREPLLHPVSLRLGATALLLGVSSATFWGFAREQFIAVASLSAGSGRSAWIALGIGGFAGAATGAASERFGLPPVLAVVWTGFAIGHAWLASGSLPLLAALVALAAIGAGYMSLTGLTILWAVRDHPQQPGAAVATAFLILAVGQTVASPVAGALVDQAGLAPAFRAAALVAVLGVLPVLHRPGKRTEPGRDDTWAPRGLMTRPRAHAARG